jgi:hypothetical protein
MSIFLAWQAFCDYKCQRISRGRNETWRNRDAGGGHSFPVPWLRR